MIADGFGLCRPPCQPRCHADGGVACAAGQAPGLQRAHELDPSPGRRRTAATSTSTSIPSPRRRRRKGRRIQLRARYQRDGHNACCAARRTVCGDLWHRRCDLPARQARQECVRARRRCHLSHLLTYARGLDGLWGAYQWLDRAPKGRNEQGIWWRRRDEYGHD